MTSDTFGFLTDQSTLMAVVLGATYPELFAAVGAHSGLPYRAAESSFSAWRAMRFGSGRSRTAGAVVTETGHVPRLIVFHGDADETVGVVNATALVKQWLQLAGRSDVKEADLEPAISLTVRDAGGHPYTRSIYRAASQTVVELWIVHGLAHAWSGGASGAAYTDTNAPSAGEQMLHFFCGATFSGSPGQDGDVDSIGLAGSADALDRGIDALEIETMCCQ